MFESNVKKASDFYQQLLNSSPTKKDHNSCTFTFGNIKYFIHKKDNWEKGMPPNEDHIEFEVEDLDKELVRLRQQGFTLEIDPKKYYWGYSAYLSDPEGRFIELIQKK